MPFFANLSIRTKLVLLVAVALVLVAATAVTGIRSARLIDDLTREITTQHYVKIKLLSSLKDNVSQSSRAMRTALLARSPAEVAKEVETIEAAKRKNDEVLPQIEPLVTREKGKAIFRDVKAGREAFGVPQAEMARLLSAGKRDEALTALFERARPAQLVYVGAIDKLMDYQQVLMDEATQKAEGEYQASIRLMVGFGIGAALVLGLLAFVVIRSITRPLAQAVDACTALSQGDFDRHIDVRTTEETGRLLSMVAETTATLKSFYAAEAEMKRRHDDGVLSHRIDAARFPGGYGEIAKATNELAASHIAVKMRIIEVVKGYAQGDFRADMDELPGEKAVITQVIRGVKSNMQAINGQIRKLVEAASRGDFSERGDANRFENEFRAMVNDLNTLMATCDTGLSEVSRVLEAMSQGDLTQRMTGDYQGTFATLQTDIASTAEKLDDVVTRIRKASEAIDGAAGEIAAGNQDLSSRTEQQASSLEETASSMEELTSTVKQNAENSRQANSLASTASEKAVAGGQTVGSVVDTMREIAQASRRIQDIISVIDGIAFQTNILALNAAVEAARAGEQGRGFAVVASEVRNLAQRSAGAAKEIKELIGASVSKVDAGTTLVDAAGAQMNEIVQAVQRVSDIISEITAASNEQATGIEQVNQAINQMDQVTQQNAALVEEAAAAAESLREQAGGLVEAVNVFALAQRAEARTPAASPKPKRATAAWDGKTERRGPDRAKNVTRIAKREAAPAQVSNAEKLPSGEWTAF